MINKFEAIKEYPYMAYMFPDFYGRENWCCARFGLGLGRWLLFGNRIYFKNETDRNWFVLRWS